MNYGIYMFVFELYIEYIYINILKYKLGKKYNCWCKLIIFNKVKFIRNVFIIYIVDIGVIFEMEYF